jgi:hypothetical protein
MVASNKDKIEKPEAELQEVHDGIQHMECEKMQSTEDSLNEIKNLLSGVNQFSEKSTNNTKEKGPTSHGSPTRDKSQQATPPLKHLKMDFPRFSKHNPTEWLNRVAQFFEYQGTTS